MERMARERLGSPQSAKNAAYGGTVVEMQNGTSTDALRRHRGIYESIGELQCEMKEKTSAKLASGMATGWCVGMPGTGRCSTGTSLIRTAGSQGTMAAAGTRPGTTSSSLTPRSCGSTSACYAKSGPTVRRTSGMPWTRPARSLQASRQQRKRRRLHSADMPVREPAMTAPLPAACRGWPPERMWANLRR
nr:MAG TPA: hypothetical protein [Caudoviricetes sp.]